MAEVNPSDIRGSMSDDKASQFWPLLDRLYKQANGHIPCGDEPHRCRKGCEPGFSETTIVLLPGELGYISNRLGEPAKFETTILDDGREVGLQKSKCPYLDGGGMCTIYDHRPIDCRSYPFVPAMVSGHLQYLMDSKCPIDKKLEVMRQHRNTWFKVWEQLQPFLDEAWWALYDDTDPIPDVLSVLKDLHDEVAAEEPRRTLLPILATG